MVLLIHGLLGHMRGFGQLAPDLLGYGSQQDAGPFSLYAQVEYLHALLLRENGKQPVHLLGHSIGGAIAMLFARRYPELVQSVTSMEGNFTLKDAFWSKAISEMPLGDVERALIADQHDPAAWLGRSGVTPNEERLRAALSHLTNQPASTMQAMAQSVVEITGRPEYFEDIRAVIERGTPVHLIAGDRSRDAWDVPEFVLAAARTVTILPKTGHLITIESPQLFRKALTDITAV
ncbi:MAG: alpha/beta fold hydrolase [Candidatus Baltobacteraceae bacterium]